MAADPVIVGIPIAVGLIFVAFAVLERGYKRFLVEKKIVEAEGKTIEFDLAYIVNMIVSSGISISIISVLPTLLDQIGTPTEITVGSLILNAILGYTTAYTVLDKMNQKTDSKNETVAEIKKTNASKAAAAAAKTDSTK